MELQDIAAIAEIIGVIIIVVTFVFLGLQMRQANRIASAQMHHGLVQNEIAVNAIFLEYADTWDKILNDQSLDEPFEKRKAVMLMNQFFTTMENRYWQHRLGFLSQLDFEDTQETIAITANLPAFELYQQAPSYANRSREFRDFIVGLRN